MRRPLAQKRERAKGHRRPGTVRVGVKKDDGEEAKRVINSGVRAQASDVRPMATGDDAVGRSPASEGFVSRHAQALAGPLTTMALARFGVFTQHHVVDARAS